MKNFLTISFLLTICVTAFANLALSDPPTGSPFGTIINDPGGSEGFVAIDGCETSVKLSVIVANLELDLPIPDTNGNQTLPLGVPPITVEYSINGNTREYFTLSEYSYLKTVEGVHLYKSSFLTIPIDVTNICIEPDSNGISLLHYTMRLVKRLAVGAPPYYIPYPACDYTGPDDIFSCQVFVHALGMCDQGDPDLDNIYPECNNDLLTFREAFISIECPSCDNNLDGGIDQRNEEDFHQETLNVSANPNPFNNNLEIRWSETTPIETLEIFDPTGKLVKRWESNQLNTLNALNLDVHQFPKGLYFIRAKSMDVTKVIKVVKQ